MAERYVVQVEEVGAADVALVGGKGANLGELTRIDGITVPAGFCVTTGAFRRLISRVPGLHGRLEALAGAAPGDAAALAVHATGIREAIEQADVPDDVVAAITEATVALGGDAAYAVRSSATAEDLPAASFAGQHDTYLNVVGAAAVVDHVRRCWASLFTDRAVAYRARHGVDPRDVAMAVVVQRMVAPHSSGAMFTADPVTGKRRTASVEAVLGLGEALVAGREQADVYTIADGEPPVATIATKLRAVRPSTAGGIADEPVPEHLRDAAALSDAEVVRLVELGRRIEAHFGHPQDVEWCLADGRFLIVQSRPITTLFPVPANAEEGLRVYVSVGHQQMMTDPIAPLGISVWQMTAGRPMHEAGGRLFVDVTAELSSPVLRPRVVEGLGRSDPLIGDALRRIIDRGDIPLTEPPATDPAQAPAGPPPIETDPGVVAELIEQFERSLAELRREIGRHSGPALFEFVLADVQELRRLITDPRSMRVIMAGFEARWWLDEHLAEWLGERDAVDVLTRSAPGNITSEMGLALLDVADAIRPHPAVVDLLRAAGTELALDDLDGVDGGPAARQAIEAWLARFGMRCVGEIDITRPRWSEQPGSLVPTLLGHVEHFEHGAAARRFEQGRRDAEEARRDLLARLRTLDDGERKAAEVDAAIERLRTFIGYREHPKYAIVCRYFEYKQALLREAEQLVEAGVLRSPDDSYYLTFDELHRAVRTRQADPALIERRRAAHRAHHALTPPRVLTSDGEAVTGAYGQRDVPAGALVGLGVSAGVVEGRARVVLDIADAVLEPGDILVTTHTDPSWTPVFVSIAGLVTEVGGLTTHGAVIAREYGLPAVVGVEDATRLITDGQAIRLHGSDGYVELLG